MIANPIIEHVGCHRKCDAMPGAVFGRFLIVSLKVIVTHGMYYCIAVLATQAG